MDEPHQLEARYAQQLSAEEFLRALHDFYQDHPNQCYPPSPEYLRKCKEKCQWESLDDLFADPDPPKDSPHQPIDVDANTEIIHADHLSSPTRQDDSDPDDPVHSMWFIPDAHIPLPPPFPPLPRQNSSFEAPPAVSPSDLSYDQIPYYFRDAFLTVSRRQLLIWYAEQLTDQELVSALRQFFHHHPDQCYPP